MSDETTSGKIFDLINTSDSKDTLVKILSEDRDMKKLLYWYILGFIGVIFFLFINVYASLAIVFLLGTNMLMMISLVTGKLKSMVTILNTIREESEVITYNKGLTDAINLLFHNNLDLREKGKDMILKEFPEHSEIILSSERILIDSVEDDYADYITHVKISDRIN